MKQTFNSLFDMMGAFPDERSAIDHLRVIRWGPGNENAYCPHCGSIRVNHFSNGKDHKRGDCRKRFPIKVGTIFEDTKIPVRKWFTAIWFIASHKKDVASTTVARDIKLTQKTVWSMLQRLRHGAAGTDARKNGSDAGSLVGAHRGNRQVEAACACGKQR
ncbi:hypothetical protein [Hoeflea sp.]|uniref:hypothetical protein n=1 Tax=Hoeflea sp. TaxID=1940281 RepID=UPI003748CCCF